MTCLSWLSSSNLRSLSFLSASRRSLSRAILPEMKNNACLLTKYIYFGSNNNEGGGEWAELAQDINKVNYYLEPRKSVICLLKKMGTLLNF